LNLKINRLIFYYCVNQRGVAMWTSKEEGRNIQGKVSHLCRW